MSSRPVTIVGAGLAGLALGRCLRQHGIAAIVLERVSSSSRHSYGITLHPWAFRPLLNTLQIDESVFKEKISIDPAQGILGGVSDRTLAPGIDTDHGAFRCHRGRLEELLREGQDIRWDHIVQDVKARSGGGVVLYLKDRKPLETEFLIGADGVHSQVRNSLIPDVEPKVLPFVVLNGRRRLSIAAFEEEVAPAMQNRTIIQSRHEDIVVEISISDYTSKQVDLSYTYSRPARKNDPLHKPDRLVSGATAIPGEFYIELQELKQLPKPFNAIFDPVEVVNDRVLHWLMRSTLGSPADMKGLTDHGVLLIGDAVHAMPILGGEGANTALKDGVDLAQHILCHGTPATSLQAFTNARHDSWKNGVEESEKRLAELHDHTRSFQ